MTLLAGLAAADAIEEALSTAGGKAHPPVGLKWPNDLLLAGGKVGGVLVQTRTRGPGAARPRAVVGIGINANTTVRLGPGEEDGVTTVPAVSLREVAGGPVDLRSLLIGTVGGLVRRLEGGLTNEVVGEYRSRCSTVGVAVEFTTDGVPMAGRAVDIATDGALVVELEDGLVRRVTAGEVRHLRDGD